MIEWIKIKKDGIYKLCPSVLRRGSSIIYMSGDNPKGSFTFGILDNNGDFVPMPDGNVNESCVAHHGKGVELVLEVRGYEMKETTIGYLVSKKRKVVIVVSSFLMPVITFAFDTIIDKITKRF